MATAGAGSVDVAKALIEAHANINATNDYGAMALDIAVAGHGTSSDIAVYLLGVGGKGRNLRQVPTLPQRTHQRLGATEELSRQ